MEIRFDKQALKKVAKEAAQEFTDAQQQAADSVYRTHKGRPVDEVRAALRRHPAVRRLEPDKELIDQMAEAIANDQRVRLNLKMR
jgi:lauroyl/myristoyl acyltransferase